MQISDKSERELQAKTILKQISRSTLMACGAYGFLQGVDSAANTTLRFRVVIHRPIIHHIRITLLPSDTYKVELLRIKRNKSRDIIVIAECTDVYAEMLSSIIYDMVNKRGEL